MSQIAQQDHLYIDVSQDIDEADSVISEVGPKLFECAKAGTISDVILRYKEDSENVTFAPIVYAYLSLGAKTLTVSWAYEQDILMGEYTQE